jgi:hypothetical protein
VERKSYTSKCNLARASTQAGEKFGVALSITAQIQMVGGGIGKY